MAYQKLLSLAEKLYVQTKAGNIEWEQTALEDTFQSTVGNYIIHISTIPTELNAPGQVDVAFQILDHKGKKIESFTDVEIGKEMMDEDKIVFYRRMIELHNSARRYASGTEKAIDSILEELDDLIPF